MTDQTPDVNEEHRRKSASVTVGEESPRTISLEAHFWSGLHGKGRDRAVVLAIWNVPFSVEDGAIVCVVYETGPSSWAYSSSFGNASSSLILRTGRQPITSIDQVGTVPDHLLWSSSSGSQAAGHIDYFCARWEEGGQFFLTAGATALAGVRGDYTWFGRGDVSSTLMIRRAEVWRCLLDDEADCNEQFFGT